jgi:type I restriction enzyme M protein
MKIERQLQGTLNTVFTELIKEKGLENRIHPYLPQEENRADITLKNKNGKALYFIELKDPTARDGKSVFDGNIVMREAARAQKNEIQYFGNCNFLACAFFDVKNFNDKVSINEGFFTLSDIVRLSNNYSPSKDILNKLKRIAEFYLDRAIEILDRKPIKFSELDELFIFKIRKLIEVFSPSISSKIYEKYTTNKQFERDVLTYTRSQLWNKPTTYEEIENLTHISLLMLISKLIFYKTYVDNQTWNKLSPMKVGDEITTPLKLEALIWKYFDEFKEITGDFELLIGERADIIFQMPFVSDGVLELVKDVLDTGGHYNFGTIPFDIIGRIFEELIREDERHKLGQYFTPPHVIDVINAFAIRKSNDKVFDPSCGSGTFLVRAYERKKQLCAEEDKGSKHEVLLNEIYGNDLSGYPAYLSMLNLAIRNTRKPSYPKIANKDFFAITADSRIVLHNQEGVLEKKALPKFDAIVGNPPYTRQEDIGTMHGTQNKNNIQALIKVECGFEPSQRTSIYGYFFYHATTFLKDDGYLAYICQNSWLDTDYGIDMQRYLQRNFEIVAIMDSEVERFFPTASVNTTIVILKRQRNEEKREDNAVKFVYFLSPLQETIKAYKTATKLKELIEQISENESNEYFRINCIEQKELKEHTKWAQFLKAPKVYFDILKRGKEQWTSLGEENGIAEVKFGIKTGCNEFFIIQDITDTAEEIHLKATVNNTIHLTSKREVKQNKLRLIQNGLNEIWLIEEEFIKDCIKSPKHLSTYTTSINAEKTGLLFVNIPESKLKKFDFLRSYIRQGIKNQINTRPTCASRNPWYDITKEKAADLMWTEMYFDRYFVAENDKGYMDIDKFYSIYLFSKKQRAYYAAILNSTFYQLYREFISFSSLGDGVTKTPVYAVKSIPVPKNLLLQKEVIATWEDLRSQKSIPFSSTEVSNTRRTLDSLFLEVIGFSKKEIPAILSSLYKELSWIISNRLQKAQSQKGVKTQRNKVEFSVYVEQLKTMLQEANIPAKNTLIFAKQITKLIKQITSESKLQKKILDTYWKEKFGELFDEKKIAGSMQGKMF